MFFLARAKLAFRLTTLVAVKRRNAPTLSHQISQKVASQGSIFETIRSTLKRLQILQRFVLRIFVVGWFPGQRWCLSSVTRPEPWGILICGQQDFAESRVIRKTFCLKSIFWTGGKLSRKLRWAMRRSLLHLNKEGRCNQGSQIIYCTCFTMPIITAMLQAAGIDSFLAIAGRGVEVHCAEHTHSSPCFTNMRGEPSRTMTLISNVLTVYHRDTPLGSPPLICACAAALPA